MKRNDMTDDKKVCEIQAIYIPLVVHYLLSAKLH